MKIDDIRQGFGSLWDSVAEGWERLRHGAAGALTRFSPGEKKFERESSEGRWRVLQCAYGSFHRSVPLPAAVQPDAAKASYRNGVLRVEMPKRTAAQPQARRIAIG